MNIHYVTYATHDQGLFKKLIHNPYETEIVVIGWGVKWNGYMDKIKGMLEYISDLPDDDVVCSLDGFDTIINRDPKDVLNIFETKFGGAKIVVSKDKSNNALRSLLTKKIFTEGLDGHILNAGMYIGYVSELKKMFKLILKQDTTDDQRALNLVAKHLDITVDYKNYIFYNSSGGHDTNKRCIFISYPGAGMEDWNGWINRVLIRGIPEYAPFFINEIIIFLIIVLSLVIYYYFGDKIRERFQIKRQTN
jgi:hypothetical protein